LLAAGYSDKVTLTVADRSPIITVIVIGRTRQQAAQTAQQVDRLIDRKIMSLQQPYNVPKNRLLTTQSLDTGDNIEVVTSRVKRVFAAFGAAGLLATAGLTIGLDALIRFRSSRRAARRARPRTTVTSERSLDQAQNRESAESLPAAASRQTSADLALHEPRTRDAEDGNHGRVDIPQPRRLNSADASPPGITQPRDEIDDGEATIVIRASRVVAPPENGRGGRQR
jgi:hypothetical protein